MKVKDLRFSKDMELGDVIEIAGDSSMGYFTTDKGYRLIVDTYNMKQIADHYKEKEVSAERAHWIKEIEGQVHNAYEGGKEEERKKWIKEAMKVGILIAKPKEQAGIAEEFKLQGRREVVEWIERNCLGCKSNTPSNADEYLGFHKEGWLAFKKGKGIG